MCTTVCNLHVFAVVQICGVLCFEAEACDFRGHTVRRQCFGKSVSPFPAALPCSGGGLAVLSLSETVLPEVALPFGSHM